MPVIFISYRRSDSQDVTGRIYDRLTAEFTPKQVFKDVDNIPLGVSFPMHIKQMLSKANVVLVIIGPSWLNAADKEGRRRLDDPGDYVRLEVELALRAEMPVIPILVSNARMPLASELPPSLRKTVERNGMAVRPDPDFNNDIGRLFSGLEHLERLLKAAKEAIPIVTPVNEIEVVDETPLLVPANEIEVVDETLVPKKDGMRRKPYPRKETKEPSAKPERAPRPRGRGLRNLMWFFLFVLLASGGAFVAYEAFTTPPWRDLKRIADFFGKRPDVKVDLAEYQKNDLVWKSAEYIKKTGPERIDVWRQAAQKGSPEGQFLFSRCLEEGAGIAKDEADGLTWLRKAAENGLAPAQVWLGERHWFAKGVPADGGVEAERWYRKAAEQGDPGGQHGLGKCYLGGHVLAKDPAEAVRWFRKAADQGYAWSHYSLGKCYANGEGVAEDAAQAVRCYRKAAELGLADGQNTLGWYYCNGVEVKKDPAEGARWYRKAAEQGNALAQNNLGNCYASGAGVAKDPAEAVRWYRKAADQGNADAKKAFESVGQPADVP